MYVQLSHIQMLRVLDHLLLMWKRLMKAVGNLLGDA